MTALQPKISVIIPAYNYGAYLGECLDSVLRQSFQNWDCIIVDNGSTDTTAEVAKAFVAKDARFHYCFTEQKGVSFARNCALKQSTAEYILPLDADDKLASSYLEEALQMFDRQPQLKLVYCEAELFGASQGRWSLPEYTWKGLLGENSIFCSAVFRRSEAIACGGFNESMKEGLEDWDFWIRFLAGNEQVYKIPKVLFFYRVKHNSRNAVLDKELQLRLRRRIYENNRSHYDAVFTTPELMYELYLLRTENRRLRQSRDYRLGSMLLTPLRFITSLFKSFGA